MTKEIHSQDEQKNTVATVAMVFSIIWLIALITVVFAWLWLPLLFLWFVLWIIGLFYRPRGKARVAICIPLIVFIAIFSVIAFIWSSVKAPAEEFVEWAKIEFENVDEETFDNERFNNITNEEFNNIISSMTEEDFKALMEASSWSNVIERGSYVIFGLLQQGLKTSFEKYNDGYIPAITDEDNIISVDINVENNEDENTNEEPENTDENTASEKVEVFSESEQNDINQILNILE